MGRKSKNKPEREKAAFTLAEVLITLGIIGVAAAMTIPALQTDIRNKELQVRLKKVYAEWSQIAIMFQEGTGTSVDQYAAQYGVAALHKELPKYVVNYSKISDYSMKRNEKDENGNHITSYDMYTLKGQKTLTVCDDGAGSGQGEAMPINGSIISFDDAAKTTNGLRMCIDINGYRKPNTLGLDIFTFRFTSDGHFIPEGMDYEGNDYERSFYSGGTIKAEPIYCNGGSDKNYGACAYYAVNDINPKGNGTYWKTFVKSF